MRLAISNIAWAGEEFWRYAAGVKQLGCAGLELAASLLWPEPVTSPRPERLEFRKRMADLGLELVGLHALLFTRPDLKIFAGERERQASIDYLKASCELCGDLGGRALVFGSPRNRQRGAVPLDEALQRGADFFRQIAEAAAQHHILVLIEPLASETDFVCSSADALRLIHLVNHPGFQLLLDAKALVDAAEDLAAVFRQCRNYLKHFHASEANLAPPGSTGIDHELFARQLKSNHYPGFVSIEMRNKFGPPEEVIRRAIGHVRRCYEGSTES